MNDDFRDILSLLLEHDAHFLIVGAHAMAAHGASRSTGDIDLFVKADPHNAPKVLAALMEFGAPLAAHGINQAFFSQPSKMYQLGRPPRRIDLLTRIDGVDFDTAWASKVMLERDGMNLPYLGRTQLLINKRAVGRPKDLLDIALMQEAWDDT